MSDRMVCVSNDPIHEIEGNYPWPCVLKGKHIENFRGIVEHEDVCPGCEPKQATHGMLCELCWERLEGTLDRVEELTTRLWAGDGIGRSAGSRVDTSRSWKIPVDPGRMAVGEILRILDFRARDWEGHIPLQDAHNIVSPYASLAQVQDVVSELVDEWVRKPVLMVASRSGAQRALLLIQEVQRARTRWPDHEERWNINDALRCPAQVGPAPLDRCNQRTLVYIPPEDYLDRSEVECSSCGHTMTVEQFQEYARPYVAVMLAARERARQERQQQAEERYQARIEGTTI